MRSFGSWRIGRPRRAAALAQAAWGSAVISAAHGRRQTIGGEFSGDEAGAGLGIGERGRVAAIEEKKAMSA